MVVTLFIAAAVPVASPAEPATFANLARSDSSCLKRGEDEVLVCAKRNQTYRIDKNVLEASRERDAAPARSPLRADVAQDDGCVGGMGCTGGVIPLVGMALVAAKAAALAANGDDWRDAFRTREDEYRLYKESEARKAKDRRPIIGFGLSR